MLWPGPQGKLLTAYYASDPTMLEMKILVVFVHPIRESFTGKVLQAILDALQNCGHDFEVADLYREQFNPVLSATELEDQFAGRTLPQEIQDEQARIQRSDALAFVFPVWWWSFPAILKGWIERVFSAGWAYPLTDDPSTSLLRSRKCLLMCCAGGSRQHHERFGVAGKIAGLVRQNGDIRPNRVKRVGG